MRIIVYGTGGIGGTVAAALDRAGHKVTAIARGAQLDAIRAKGLTIRTPSETFTQALDVVGTPKAANIGPDDMILLTMKGQHTQDALEALRAAGVTTQPIFCLQNGVGNEPRALRYFPNVHGVTVMMPAIFTTPGEVAVQSQPRIGLFYVGRYPNGSDASDAALAEILNDSDIAAFVKEDIMASKYGKLVMNLSNIIGAALGHNAPEADPLRERAKAEAYAVFEAAGITHEDLGLDHPDRVAHMNWAKVPGVENVGTSTAQSLVRGTGSVETDWLNGEIVFLGRLHSIATPVNTYLTGLAAKMAREGIPTGSLSLTDIEAGIAAQN